MGRDPGPGAWLQELGPPVWGPSALASPGDGLCSQAGSLWVCVVTVLQAHWRVLNGPGLKTHEQLCSLGKAWAPEAVLNKHRVGPEAMLAGCWWLTAVSGASPGGMVLQPWGTGVASWRGAGQTGPRC